MAIPEYFQRNAVAVSQVLSGLDEERLESMVGDVCVGVTVGPDASGREGRAMVDLLVRLLARLYPTVSVRDERGVDGADEISALARRINPRVEFSGRPTVEIVIGSAATRQCRRRVVYAGSNGWNAKLSTEDPQECGKSNNPYGAGLAACLAAADVFRSVFLPEATFDGEAEFAVPFVPDDANGTGDVTGDVGDLVLAGAGAIGNAAAWALSRTEVRGSIQIVDHESVDLGNLQRYVLAERDDEERAKASLVAGNFGGELRATAYEGRLAEYLVKKRHRVDHLLLALDSARDRRAGQASLPRRIVNAWTRPGGLGVSTHDFLAGACVGCLYLPEGGQRNEDEVIAESFGVPDRLMQIRELLHLHEGAPRDLLEGISAARRIPVEKILPFEGRTLRELYVEGFCGGAVIPLGEIGEPDDDVHVPLAHQSAMAGVLLAATAVGMNLGVPAGSVVAQYDVLKPQERFQVYAIAKDARGLCICQDRDYADVYRKKHGLAAEPQRS